MKMTDHRVELEWTPGGIDIFVDDKRLFSFAKDRRVVMQQDEAKTAWLQWPNDDRWPKPPMTIEEEYAFDHSPEKAEQMARGGQILKGILERNWPEPRTDSYASRWARTLRSLSKDK